ncbi:hypothetical protein BHM03_00042221 [Ensete ventricosum]|nr:hypothetical protein BHM03_00042221 [Ensete ventricosum]
MGATPLSVYSLVQDNDHSTSGPRLPHPPKQLELSREWEGMTGAIRELDRFSAYIRLRELDKLEDKAKGETSVDSSITYFYEGRALVMKEAEEMENTEANPNIRIRLKGKSQRTS